MMPSDTTPSNKNKNKLKNITYKKNYSIQPKRFLKNKPFQLLSYSIYKMRFQLLSTARKCLQGQTQRACYTTHSQLPEEHQMIHEMCRKFADEELAPNAGEWDKHHSFPKDAIGKLVSFVYQMCMYVFICIDKNNLFVKYFMSMLILIGYY